jgi:hypothetical protein
VISSGSSSAKSPNSSNFLLKVFFIFLL